MILYNQADADRAAENKAVGWHTVHRDHQQARERAAALLAEALRRCDADVEDLTEEVWAAAAAAVKVKNPSPETRALTIEKLRKP